MREIHRRMRVVGAFRGGKSALMLAAARLRHIAGTQWGTKWYLRMDLLRDLDATGWDIELDLGEGVRLRFRGC